MKRQAVDAIGTELKQCHVFAAFQPVGALKPKYEAFLL